MIIKKTKEIETTMMIEDKRNKDYDDRTDKRKKTIMITKETKEIIVEKKYRYNKRQKIYYLS
jgi:hypothetical protein